MTAFPSIPGIPYSTMTPTIVNFFLRTANKQKVKEIGRHEQTGRPRGEERFIDGLEKVLNR
jgi:hypothetical protein